MPTDPAGIVASMHEKTARRDGAPWRKGAGVDISDVGSAARTYGIFDAVTSAFRFTPTGDTTDV